MQLTKKAKNTAKPKPAASEKVKFGLRTKLILGITIPLVAILTIVGIVLYNQISTIVEDLKKNEIESQTVTATEYLESYFQPFMISANTLKDIAAIQDIMQATTNTGTSFRASSYYTKALEELEAMAGNQSEGLMQLWIAGVKNNSLLTNTGETNAEGFVTTERDWFKDLEANNGETILTSVYEDALTGELVVTIAVGVKDRRDHIIGAVGMDIALSELSSILDQLSIGENGYITVYDSADNIIYHPDQSLIMQQQSNIAYSANMKNALAAKTNTETALEYTRGDLAFCGAVNYNDSIGWTVLGCMENEEYRQEIVQSTTIVLSGFSICALLLIGIIILISSSIVRPIMNLNGVAANLAAGNLDVTVDISSKDEVGFLAKNISALVERLKLYIVYIDEIADLLHEMGTGNLCLTFQNSFDGDFKKVKDEMENTVSLLNDSLSAIRTAASQVDAGSDQVASGAQALSQGATEQASATEQLSATVNDINLNVQNSGVYANEANEKTNDAGIKMTRCNEQMQEMLAAMNDISRTSEEIGKIIKTIEDIAFQTNILALNAAVEAARAGSAGKGFAVVADEVRNLAGKSAEASQNTATLIATSMAAVNRGAKLANSTAQQLQEVAQGAQVVSEMVNKIAATAQEQSASIQQVTTGLDQISAVVQTNSATAEQSAAASQELASQAAVLKDLVGKFTLQDTTF